MNDVLCECGHVEFDHSCGDAANGCEVCGCEQFKPLSTLAQLKEAWELVGKLAEAKVDSPAITAVNLVECQLLARCIRGEKGE